nr:hypothetical protein [Tanacetum cinerariifolium]
GLWLVSARIVFAGEEGLGDQEDASKQGRSIAHIDQDEGTTLVDDTQGRINKEDLFGIHDLSGDEVFVDVTASKNVKQDATVAEKKFSTADLVTTAREVVTAGKVVTAAEKEFSIADLVTTASEVFTGAEDVEAKDKGKGIMVEPEKPLKMKDQIALDKEVARKLEAEMKAKMEEEERIAREKSKSFEEVQKAFNKTIDWVNNFVAMDSESVKDRAVESSKRVGKELEQESAKKHKLDEQVQAIVADNDTRKLKRCLEIVPKDDDVTIEATPISSKSPTIVGYKI